MCVSFALLVAFFAAFLYFFLCGLISLVKIIHKNINSMFFNINTGLKKLYVLIITNIIESNKTSTFFFLFTYLHTSPMSKFGNSTISNSFRRSLSG